MKTQNILKHRVWQDGFTLIELLVVIAIISLLSSLVLASLNSARVKARDVRRIADINQLRLALQLYYDNNNRYPVAEQTWWCLGHTTATGCWGNPPQYTGRDSINADLAPYMPTIPDDPKKHSHNPPTCYGDAYAYLPSNGGQNATLHWYYESNVPNQCGAGYEGVPGSPNSCGRYCFLDL